MVLQTEDGSRWLYYPSGDHPRLGACLVSQSPSPGNPYVSLFWPGEAKPEQLAGFLLEITREIRANRAPPAGPPIFTTVTEPDLAGGEGLGGRRFPPADTPVLPDPKLPLHGVLRFEATFRPPRAEGNERARPEVIAWATIPPAPNEFDSVGVFASSSDIYILQKRIASFVEGTSREKTSASETANLLNNLVKDVAELTKEG